MSLLRSAPDGFALMGWRRFGLACALTWLGPAFLGGLMLGLQWLAGSQMWGEGWLMLWAFSVLLMLSPALSWFGLVLATPFVALLMDRGWFGWVAALCLGLTSGAVTGLLMGNLLAIGVGGVWIALLRAAMARLAQAAFEPAGHG